MNTILDYLIRVRGGQQGQRELKKLAGGLNTFSGRLQTMIALSVAAAPGLLAIASSAAAAGAAAGVVGAAGLAAFAVSLGGVLAIGKQALGQLDKVRSAQDAYNLAVEQYGPASDQATAARAKFNAVLDQNGGERTLALLNDLTALTDRFTKATEPARVAMTRTFGQGITAANKLLPAFTEQTNLAANALRRGLTNSFRQLGGGEMRSNIERFGNAGAVSIQPILHGLTDIAFAILRLLRPALKYVVQAAFAFQEWAHNVRAATSDSGKMTGVIEMLVGHFKAWWSLGKALANTLRILFTGSEKTGKGFVESLTRLVVKMNEWLDAAGKTGKTQRFFEKYADTVGAIVTAVGTLASAALPALKSAGSATGTVFSLLLLRLQVLADVIRFLGPAAGPLLIAFLAWKATVVAITIAQTAWNAALLIWSGILKVGAALTKVWTAAQWLWNAALAANPIGLVIIGIAALIAIIVVVVKHWGWFKQAGIDAWNWIKGAAQSAWQWIKDNWTKLLPLLAGPFGLLVKVIVTHFDGIKEAFKSAINWIIERWNGLEFQVPELKIAGHNVLPGGGSKIGAPDIPLLAEGGNVRQRGSVIVGDAGPEVLDLPAGATVTPLEQSAAPSWPTGDIVLKVDRRTLTRISRDEVMAGMARGG